MYFHAGLYMFLRLKGQVIANWNYLDADVWSVPIECLYMKDAVLSCLCFSIYTWVMYSLLTSSLTLTMDHDSKVAKWSSLLSAIKTLLTLILYNKNSSQNHWYITTESMHKATTGLISNSSSHPSIVPWRLRVNPTCTCQPSGLVVKFEDKPQMGIWSESKGYIPMSVEYR